MLAYYCLHKLHMLPSQYINLPDEEKAFVIAAIQIKVEDEKKKEREMRAKGKGKRKR